RCVKTIFRSLLASASHHTSSSELEYNTGTLKVRTRRGGESVSFVSCPGSSRRLLKWGLNQIMKATKASRIRKSSAVTLRAVAEHLGLTAGTVSAVLNDSPAGRSIPAHTRARVLDAARELNYRPN